MIPEPRVAIKKMEVDTVMQFRFLQLVFVYLLFFSLLCLGVCLIWYILLVLKQMH